VIPLEEVNDIGDDCGESGGRNKWRGKMWEGWWDEQGPMKSKRITIGSKLTAILSASNSPHAVSAPRMK
jgi:hypothetical protein